MRILVTGIGGQDGYYLSSQLLAQGHTVSGIYRTPDSVKALQAAFPPGQSALDLFCGDVTDRAFLREVVTTVIPDQIYNLAGQSRVGKSFEIPEQTFCVNTLAPLYLLELIRELNPKTRFFQACSSEIFGEDAEVPQSEKTPLAPASPYAVSKASAYWLVDTYRRAHGLFACNAILYNHESPLRDESFLSGKVVYGIARILAGEQRSLTLGNLEVRRDWGFAGDYVEAMISMMQQDKPGDFIIATGKTHSVGDFVRCAFEYAGLDWQKYVVVDKQLFRPTDAHFMMGDARLAQEQLGWKPQVDFQALVRLMVDNALTKKNN